MIPTLPNGEPQNGPPAPAAPPPRTDRAQSSQEALGFSKQSGLLKASVQAGVGFVVLFAALTFGPYFWDKSQAGEKAPPADKAGTPPADKDKPAVAPTPSTADPIAPGKLPAAGSAGSTKQPGKDDEIVKKLGEGGTKTAPPRVNPLDKKEDDILKDIK